ncbi:MAG: RluA family pseudouridine synthase [Lachnospiraceae bacterium]|nr:RluA family pseudouridine synthase [Lachnospiraceae bacterium]
MILYEDKDIVVCHKPAGVAVQSASLREKDMVSILKNRAENPLHDVYVVHRLDQPVEGVLVFAKNKRAAADLSRQITDGSMKKIYHAVVSAPLKSTGNFAESFSEAVKSGQETLENGSVWYTLTDYLVRDARNNRSFVSDKKNNNAKKAELRFRVLKWWTDTLLVEVELKTGRHHQIRVQMAHAGLPLVGDRKYNPDWKGELGTPALCAVSLSFCHPSSKKRLLFETKPQAEIFSTGMV